MRLVEAGVYQPTRQAGWVGGAWARVSAARVPFAVAAVLLVGAGVRFWGLGTKSLWFDETYSVFIARQALVDIPRMLQTYDTHPPLHYVLLHVWMALFGSGEASIRIPSVLASVGAILLTFFLGRRLAGDRVGLLAAALLAVSPFQVTSAQEARMYPFLTLFGLGASYALWLALEEGRRRHWTAYALLMVLALYTHHFAFLLLGAQAVYVLATYRRKAAVGRWFLSLAVVAVAYLPLVPTFLAQMGTGRGWPDFRPPFGLRALTDMMGMFSFGGGLFGMGTYFRVGALPLEYRAAIILPFAILGLAGAAGLEEWRRRGFILSYWLVPVVTVSVISLQWNMFYQRYFSFVLPPFLILLAAGVFYVAERMRGTGKVVTTVSLLLVLAAFNLPVLANLYREPSTYDWRAAAQHVSAKAGPKDFILFIPGFARIPFQYYFSGPQVQASLNPKLLRFAQEEMRLAEGDTERFAAIAKKYPRMWIVATIPIGYKARQQIAKVLAPAFREADGRSFGLVFTFLWESRLYGTAPGNR
ncbi:MAG: hypothetical protein XU14_C0008G0043 [Armatimonadetes bacterium CSP1-3]|nr:MAG: hypothetical protein XU14_C0008G0043 [Armatimonadetes bacterium CSP1-3]